MGGDATQVDHIIPHKGFQSTPPVWAETPLELVPDLPAHDFNPLRPCGRRLEGVLDYNTLKIFQSTPPVWAETELRYVAVTAYGISIHSARVGGDLSV